MPQVVFEHQLRLVEQAADECRLAVVDAAAGDEAEKLLLLLFGEPGFDVGRAVHLLCPKEKPFVPNLSRDCPSLRDARAMQAFDKLGPNGVSAGRGYGAKP